MKPIKKEIAIKMISDYRNRRATIPNHNGKDKPDTDSVWISKDLIDDFFKRNTSSDGLRIYFGEVGIFSELNYPDLNDQVQVKHVHECINQTNLIFVATKSLNGKPSSLDANMLTKNKTLTEKEIEEENKAIMFSKSGGMPENDFEMCPPSTSGCVDIEL